MSQPVVDEAHTAERTGKLVHLLRRWVKSIPVGQFRLCAHRFSPFLVLDGLKELEQVYYMESKMSSESAWEGVPLHPGPETRNAPSIRVSEDRGFTARFDKVTRGSYTLLEKLTCSAYGPIVQFVREECAGS
jgi:hypothetical protein